MISVQTANQLYFERQMDRKKPIINNVSLRFTSSNLSQDAREQVIDVLSNLECFLTLGEGTDKLHSINNNPYSPDNPLSINLPHGYILSHEAIMAIIADCYRAGWKLQICYSDNPSDHISIDMFDEEEANDYDVIEVVYEGGNRICANVCPSDTPSLEEEYGLMELKGTVVKITPIRELLASYPESTTT